MQLHRREVLLISAIFISITLISSAAFAAFAQVALTPTQTVAGKSSDFTLSVSNAGGDNINKVELTLPQNNNVPLYQISVIGNPGGWSYETRFALGAPTPFKVIWSTSSSGIPSGSSLNFNFAAQSPAANGSYPFQWKATDIKGVDSLGAVNVFNALPPSLAKLDMKSANSTSAGSDFTIAVTALDQNGNTKTDYTGTIKFSSTDPKAVLPTDYTFQLSDAGTKTFTLRLKTAGDQVVHISDGNIDNSVKATVLQGNVNSVSLQLSNSTVQSNNSVTLTVWSTDAYENKKDVTKDSTFSIDKEAKGMFANNTYKTEVVGSWTMIATYISGQTFTDGKSLAVTATPPQPVQTNATAPPPEKKLALELSSDDSVNIPVNSSTTFSITAKNTGDVDLKNVTLAFTGFPESQMNISPSVVDIDKGKSSTFTATIFVSQKANATDVTFLSLSTGIPSDKLNASKVVRFTITEPGAPTGKFTLSKNLTYLGIAIVVAVVLILLFWSLFLREGEDKKKKPEKSES